MATPRLHVRPARWRQQLGTLLAETGIAPGRLSAMPGATELPVAPGAGWHAAFVPGTPPSGMPGSEFCRSCLAHEQCSWLFQRVDTLPPAEDLLLWVETAAQKGMRGRLEHLASWDGDLWLTPQQETSHLFEQGRRFVRSAGEAAAALGGAEGMRAFLRGPAREFALGLLDVNTSDVERMAGVPSKKSPWPPLVARALRELGLDPDALKPPLEERVVRQHFARIVVRDHPDRHPGATQEERVRLSESVSRAAEARNLCERWLRGEPLVDH